MVVYILIGIIGLYCIVNLIFIVRIITTLKELGEFLTAIGVAMTDRQVSKEELKQRFDKGKCVVNIWKRTPKEYKFKKENT